MPVVLPVLIPFLVILSALTVLALQQTENMWLRPLLEALAHPHGSFLKRIALRAASFVVSGVLWIERQVRHALADFASASLHVITQWFNGLATLVHHWFREIADLATDTADAFAYLRHHTIPHLIGAAVRPLERLAHDAYADARRSISLVHRAERDFTRGIDRLAHAIEAELARRLHGIDRLIRDGVIPRLRATERAVAGIATRELPALWGRERALEREVYGDLRARLGRIEKALGLGLLAGIVYKILARVAPWLFCRNVSKLGRTVCGMNESSINALIAGLIGALAITDLRTLVRLMEATEEEAARELKRLLSAF